MFFLSRVTDFLHWGCASVPAQSSKSPCWVVASPTSKITVGSGEANAEAVGRRRSNGGWGVILATAEVTMNQINHILHRPVVRQCMHVDIELI